MVDGALASDHVNYLILRYLQENGFENAAKSLYREWHRDEEARDPEDLPFAPVVKQHELVHVIQDGLYHDQLQATVGSGARRFHFTATGSDLQVQRESSKANLRRQSTYATHDQEDFPVPQPKRARSTNAEPATNGDAMDIDDKPDDEDQEEESTSEQEREQSEPAPVEVIETKFAATQTDKSKKVHTTTIYWTLATSVPAAILHLLWSPPTITKALVLTAGEALCRLYDLSPSNGIDVGVDSIDPIEMSSDHCVTAVAWHPQGQKFVGAFKAPALSEGHPDRHQLIDIDLDGRRQQYEDMFDMFTIALRFNQTGDKLFSLSTDGMKSVVQARDMTNLRQTGLSIAYEEIDGKVVLDLVCISDTTFAICGKGLLAVWSLASEYEDDETASRLVQVYSHLVGEEVLIDKVRYDSQHRVLVAASSSNSVIYTLREEDNNWVEGPSITTPRDATPSMSAMAFQPRQEVVSTSDSTLAMSFIGDGVDEVWIYRLTDTADAFEVVDSVSIGPQEPPLALAWTPTKHDSSLTNGNARSGRKLAAASDEAIKIWDVTADGAVESVLWKAAPAKWYQADDNNLPDDEDGQTEPTLAWDSRGERLAFAVGRKMAIVSISDEDDSPMGEEAD